MIRAYRDGVVMMITFSTPLPRIKKAAPGELTDREAFLMRIWLGAVCPGQRLDEVTAEDWRRGFECCKLVVNASSHPR